MACSRRPWSIPASTMVRGRSLLATIDLEGLGPDRGGHLLINESLRGVPVGARVGVLARDPNLRLHLVAWARSQGHQVDESSGLVVVKGRVEADRWRHAERAGGAVV